jgi:hypothetical protein
MSKISYNGESLELRTSLLGYNLSLGPCRKENASKLRELIAVAGLGHIWKLQALLDDPDSSDLERLLALVSELEINPSESMDSCSVPALKSSQLEKSCQSRYEDWTLSKENNAAKSSDADGVNTRCNIDTDEVKIPTCNLEEVHRCEKIALEREKFPIEGAELVRIIRDESVQTYLYYKGYFVARREGQDFKFLNALNSRSLEEALFQPAWVGNLLFLQKRLPGLFLWNWNFEIENLRKRDCKLRPLFLLKFETLQFGERSLLCSFSESATAICKIYGEYKNSSLSSLDAAVGNFLTNLGLDFYTEHLLLAPPDMLKLSLLNQSIQCYGWLPAEGLSKNLFCASLKQASWNLKLIFFFDENSQVVAIGHEKEGKVADLSSEQIATLPEDITYSSRDRKKIIPVSMLHLSLTSRLSPCGTFSS